MTAAELLNLAAEAGFVVIFIAVLGRAIGRPTPANSYAAFFFGISFAAVLLDVLRSLLDVESEVFTAIQGALLVLWPYPLLRLAHEFTGARRIALRAAEFGAGISVGAVLTGAIENGLVALVAVAYFAGTVGYASLRFVRGAQRLHGLPRRRLLAAAGGSGFIALLILTAIPAGIQPEGPWASLGQVFAFLAGLAYFLAFAPPAWLRRAWLAGDLQQFIVQSILAAPRGPAGLTSMAKVLEENVRQVIGAPAVLLVPSADGDRLLAPTLQRTVTVANLHTTVAWRCFHSQQAILETHPEQADPENAEAYRALNAGAVLAVPVTLLGDRYGVLTLLVERTPMFADADLQLMQVLADQIAVVLRDRRLLNEAAAATAQQEALRLKEDFLSAAAHDLKTPLTTLLAQSQLMRRFAMRDPQAPADFEGIERMVTEAQRMRRLVTDLLDASRADQDGFVGATRPVDLLLLAKEVTDGMGHRARRVEVDGLPCVAMIDRDRMAQVLENLLDNALKYSPGGGTVRVGVQPDGESVTLSVSDDGVGIPQGDIEQIFERFRRGSTVDERRFSGLGLGLYLCKRIVDEHGGTITVSSTQGQGSTFAVSLPRTVTGGEAIR